MKKVLTWPIAVITSLLSLAAMYLFDLILTVIYYFLGKIPFLTDIIDFIGEILDLGLTVLVGVFILTFIWGLGKKLIEKIIGEHCEYEKTPIYYTNNCLLLVFLAMVIFLGIQFVPLITPAVTYFTEDSSGITKILLFFKAIKEVFLHVCSENAFFYRIGGNSLFVAIANIFFSKYVH